VAQPEKQQEPTTDPVDMTKPSEPPSPPPGIQRVPSSRQVIISGREMSDVVPTTPPIGSGDNDGDAENSSAGSEEQFEEEAEE
jgi:hypothetical protein